MQGIHLIKHSIYRTQELGGQYLLLGTGHMDSDFRCLTLDCHLPRSCARPVLQQLLWRSLPQMWQRVPVDMSQPCMCRRLDRTEFKDHADVRLMVMYSEALSHLIYAAADVVLVRTLSLILCMCMLHAPQRTHSPQCTAAGVVSHSGCFISNKHVAIGMC